MSGWSQALFILITIALSVGAVWLCNRWRPGKTAAEIDAEFARMTDEERDEYLARNVF